LTRRRSQRAVDFRLDLLLPIMGKRLCPDRATHIVDKNIDATEPLASSLNAHHCAVENFEISDDRQRFGAVPLRLLPHLFDQVRAVHEGDFAALPREAEGNTASDPLRRARDKSDLTGEASRVGRHRLRPPICDSRRLR
jgi:hypothetical protein